MNLSRLLSFFEFTIFRLVKFLFTGSSANEKRTNGGHLMTSQDAYILYTDDLLPAKEKVSNLTGQNLLLSLITISFLSAFANDSNEAFFTIQENESNILVHAELPWTIRNALYQYKPELEFSQDQTAFDDAFFDYVRSTITFLDSNQDSIKLIAVIKDYVEGDSLLSNYIFEFEKGRVFIVSNSLMFNIYNDQENHHTIFRRTVPISFTTSIEQAAYYVEKPFNKRYYLFSIPLIFLVGFVVIRKVQASNRRVKRKKSV